MNVPLEEPYMVEFLASVYHVQLKIQVQFVLEVVLLEDWTTVGMAFKQFCHLDYFVSGLMYYCH